MSFGHSRYLLLWASLLVVVGTTASQAKEYEVYFLGGQSNMEGFGRNDELPADQQGEVPGVMIFHGNTSPDATAVDGRGKWTVLRPGHGNGFATDGPTPRYSGTFGIELTLARKLKELRPQANIAFIKYARGGTSIDAAAARNFGSWDPDFRGGEGEGKSVNQYDHALATIRNATAVSDIDGDGQPDTLKPMGIFWMQGESDGAIDEPVAKRYGANLKRLMELLRAALRYDNVPVVVGRISDSGKDGDGKVWDFGGIVREAQDAYCTNDPRAAIVTSTDSYGYSDPWHYDTAGYLDLGKQFAEAWVKADAKK